MIEKIIEYSIRNRMIIILATLGMVVLGLYALHKTPIDAIPDLSESQVIVFTDWMGRSPKEIEDQITYPLSVNLQGLAGVKAIRSSSEFNFSMINIIFDDRIDFYFARQRVLERLTLASTFLPPGVTPYMAPDATALGQIFWYSVEGKDYGPEKLRSLQDWFIRYQLNSVPGVAQVASVGGFPKEYQVDVDPEKLRAFGVTLGQMFSAIERSNSSVGGRVVQKNRSEYLVRGVGWITSLQDIEDTVVTERNGVPVTVKDIANVTVGPQFRRSVLEKDGRETVGGVVMMRYGENPLEVTQRIKDKIRDLQKGLPAGVKIVPFYDRTRLIEGAIHTVTRTLIEELVIASLAILLILTHLGSAFVVCITLPLAVLFSFILMNWFGVASNIMSLSGIAISIGILVDQAVVMVENSTHYLTRHFKGARVTGDITELVIKPCRDVGRPIFFSVVIMVITFLPVFALGGIEGKMFHPLAFTKTFALIGVAILSITLVPAIIPIFIRGRLAREEDNIIVRSFINIYKPVLSYLLLRPKTVLWLFVILLSFGVYLWRGTGREFMPPLNEGTILDMPISSPRLSVTEAADDIKQRDAVIREFPEVEGVVGKSGRAETPTDPSPLDMIETVVNLRPIDLWPKRHLRYDDALAEKRRIIERFIQDGFMPTTTTLEQRDEMAKAVMDSYTDFDARMRSETLRRMIDFEGDLGRTSLEELADYLFAQIETNGQWKRKPTTEERKKITESAIAVSAPDFRTWPLLFDVETAANQMLADLASIGCISSATSALAADHGSIGHVWNELTSALGFPEQDLFQRAQAHITDFQHRQWEKRLKSLNWEIFDIGVPYYVESASEEIRKAASAQDLWNAEKDTTAPLSKSIADLKEDFDKRAFLWQANREDLLQELDTRVRLLGWVNIWTQPIVNRIDMLATGVRTMVGIKVYGPDSDTIQNVSNQIASVVSKIQGAVDVAADQTVGKGYVEVKIDRQKAARYGINVGDIQDVIEIALGGKPITTTVEGRERYPIRLRYARDFRTDEESIKRLLISAAGNTSGGEMGSAAKSGSPTQVLLADVADVQVVEGPVMIKSENGLLRNYVQLNVRDRDIVGFVEEAQRTVAQQVKLAPGSYLEWTGQYEYQVRAKKTLRLVFPAVILLIFLILFMTYNDLADALLMMLAVPGALAGGVIFQHIFGYNFSVAVWVGYIACFGMATETGIIMLVYLREAIAERGGLAGIRSLGELADAVVTGAVHRLRPKLLTEGTAIIGLAPMLWAHGVGSEVIKPMAAPVLGGLLIADEVIDIFIPVLFYHVRAWRWKRLHNAENAIPEAVDAANSSQSGREVTGNV